MKHNPKVRFEPRRKKLSGPRIVGTMKRVRIDARTEIMVPSDMPDDVARQRFFNKINRIRPSEPAILNEVKKEMIEDERLNGEEIPVGSLEEMETAIAGIEDAE